MKAKLNGIKSISKYMFWVNSLDSMDAQCLAVKAAIDNNKRFMLDPDVGFWVKKAADHYFKHENKLPTLD